MAGEPSSSSLAITLLGSLGEDGKGSFSSASAAKAALEGATFRWLAVRTYRCARSAARVRTSPLCDCCLVLVSVAIWFFLFLLARFPHVNTPCGDGLASPPLDYLIQLL